MTQSAVRIFAIGLNTFREAVRNRVLGVLVLFGGVSVLASLVPAARAARTSPVEVLRVD